MNSYQNYLLNLPEHIYKGEPISALKDKLNISKLDDNMDIPIKPPKGNILVGKEYDNWWISQKKAFYGWNIVKLSIMSTQIE